MNIDFMYQALELAKNSEDEIPVGAIILKNGEIVSKARNETLKRNDVTAHAEMIAIKEAQKKFGKYLSDCDMYVTLEPCPMCAWAILLSGIKNVYFGAYDNLYGAFGSKINLNDFLNKKINIRGGVLEEECSKILKDYFKRMRN